MDGMTHRSDYHSIPRQEEKVAVAEVLAEVQEAGEELLDAFERAKRATAGWQAGDLTDDLVESALDRCMARLAATNCWGEQNRILSSELWRIAGKYLKRGHLQVRARNKPRGYAGDFQMLSWIIEDDRSTDPLGRTLDRYFQIQAAPRAVRGRTEIVSAGLASHLSKRSTATLHVTSVGSGPAIDVARGLQSLGESWRERTHVTLFDIDPDALESARTRLATLIPPENCHLRRENIFRLAEQQTVDVEGLPAADLLICSGLFDYLPDQTAAPMLEWLWERIGAGGRMLVGNFAPHNPSRAYMEWIGNWYLIYRTTGQLAKLARRGGIPQTAFQIQADPTGIDLFIAAEKSIRV